MSEEPLAVLYVASVVNANTTSVYNPNKAN